MLLLSVNEYLIGAHRHPKKKINSILSLTTAKKEGKQKLSDSRFASTMKTNRVLSSIGRTNSLCLQDVLQENFHQNFPQATGVALKDLEFSSSPLKCLFELFISIHS